MAARFRRFVDFCTADPARYQLLFQRTLPGFEPSPRSYAPAMRALDGARELLARTLQVDPGVDVPRPQTEELARRAGAAPGLRAPRRAGSASSAG